jgi:hypothetical protein
MDPSGLIRDPAGEECPPPTAAPALRRIAPRPADVLPTTRHRLPDHVVVRPLVLETVVLNLETGQYHGLNPMAGAILELLGSGLTVVEVADRLAAKTAGTPANEVLGAIRKTCAALLARELLMVDTSCRARRAAAA